MQADLHQLAPLLADATPGVVSYFTDSNFAGQVIVVVLVIFSFAAWSLMFGKWMDLKRMSELNHTFDDILLKEPSILAADPLALEKFKGPYAVLTKLAVRGYYRGAETALTPELRIGAVTNALQRGVAEATILYESKMVFLSTIVSGAPLLGLLGTVWGVMDSFGAIAVSSQPATIQMLAPGVSGALLTTVAGLLVAIPSVFGFNYLLTQTKLHITELENFASNLNDRIELEAHQELQKQGHITPSA